MDCGDSRDEEVMGMGAGVTGPNSPEQHGLCQAQLLSSSQGAVDGNQMIPLDRFGDFLPGDSAFQDKDFAPGVGQQVAIPFAPGGNRPDINAQKAFSGMTTLCSCAAAGLAAG